MRPKTAQLWGAALALLGVMLGAFGAHALKALLRERQMVEVWQTGVYYQWFHALALLATSGNLKRGPATCWLLGVLLFSGSLYLLAIAPVPLWVGALTPLGGMLFIAGWIWFMVDLARRKN
jgi:uncharacterized membrane protein YgdD (TMEM256/DUF423 family)